MKQYLNPEAQRSHNFRNTVHTAMLVAGAVFLTGAMAYSVLGYFGLIAALVVCLVGMIGVQNVSPQMVLKLYKARPISEAEMPELQEIVRNLAVGNRDDAAIAVTDGLLRSVTLRQLTGILAHETAHIVNGDLRVMGTADVLNRVTNFMSTLGLLGIPAVFGFGVELPIGGLLFLIFAPMIGGLLQLGLSRAREYDADLDGVTLTGDPEGLASALMVLEEKQKGMWEGLFLPGSRAPQPSLLRTHPKTEDRIARLRAMHGLASTPAIATPGNRPQPSFVPPSHEPRIQWHRLGVYY
jgi:heat shock protein HtpX